MKSKVITALSSAVLGLSLARLVDVHSPNLAGVCIVLAYITIRGFLATAYDVLNWSIKKLDPTDTE